MKELPTEVFRTIGSYLTQQDQKECMIVSKQWRRIFAPLVFAKAVLLTRKQVESYLRQSDILKKQTISLHLVAPISDEEFQLFVECCPKVKDLTLFSNYSNKLEVNSAIQLISKYWSSSLTKIRMDSLLMPKALKFLAHQLQNITGDMEDLFIPGTTDMYSFPNLKTLEIENGDTTGERTIADLNQLHSSCPKLKDLTLCSMRFPVFPDMYRDVQPFSLTSFHLKNCDGIIQENTTQLLRIFPNLNTLSLLRTESIIRPDLVDVVHSLHGAYPAISHYSPQIRNLSIDYVYGNIDTMDFFKNLLLSFQNLHTLHLELSCLVAGVSLREKVSLSNILTSAPHLKKLSIFGLAHLVTVDGFEQYCIGKIGHYDNRVRRIVERDPFETFNDPEIPEDPEDHEDYEIPEDHEDHEDQEDYENHEDRENWDIPFGGNINAMSTRDAPSFPPQFEIYSVSGVDYLLFFTVDGRFGEGEVLVEEGSELMISKKMGCRDSSDKSHRYWPVPQQPRSLRSFNFSPPNFCSRLQELRLEMVTLRNPTFQWINACCPHLIELSILQTGAYPWCNIYLKDLKKLRRFSMSFELYYEILPVLIMVGDETTRIFKPATIRSKTYVEDPQFQHAELESLYKVTIHHSRSLEQFLFNSCKTI